MNPSLKKTRTYLFYILILSLFFGCTPKKERRLNLAQKIAIDSISAGSGLCETSAGLWIIGDDSPDLHLINEKGEILEKFRLSKIPSKGQLNYAKSIKPDFEAMDEFNDTLLILGSGSSSFTRDTAFVIDSKNKKILAQKSLHNLYQKFYLKGDFPLGKSINIEGLANDGHYFYFLHRGNVCGNNRIYLVNKKMMINYIFDETNELPSFTSSVFSLPTIDSNQSGFSGATYSAKEQALYVTISVEETTDVYHDGAILGSFIAKIDLEKEHPKMSKYWPIQDKNGEFIATKMESLILKENAELKILTISDNDNGKTDFYTLILQ